MLALGQAGMANPVHRGKPQRSEKGQAESGRGGAGLSVAGRGGAVRGGAGRGRDAQMCNSCDSSAVCLEIRHWMAIRACEDLL